MKFGVSLISKHWNYRIDRGKTSLQKDTLVDNPKTNGLKKGSEKKTPKLLKKTNKQAKELENEKILLYKAKRKFLWIFCIS